MCGRAGGPWPGKGGRVCHLQPQPAGVRHRVLRGGPGQGHRHDHQSPLHGRGGVASIERRRRPVPAHGAGLPGEGAGCCRRGRDRGGLRVRGRGGRHPVRVTPARRSPGPGRIGRARGRSSGAAVFERHHRAAQGRDAHAPQPGGQHLPDHARRAAGGGGDDGRRAAVLPHLRDDHHSQHGAALRGHGGDDATVRDGELLRAGGGARDRERLPGAAHHFGPGQVAGRRRA